MMKSSLPFMNACVAGFATALWIAVVVGAGTGCQEGQGQPSDADQEAVPWMTYCHGNNVIGAFADETHSVIEDCAATNLVCVVEGGEARCVDPCVSFQPYRFCDDNRVMVMQCPGQAVEIEDCGKKELTCLDGECCEIDCFCRTIGSPCLFDDECSPSCLGNPIGLCERDGYLACDDITKTCRLVECDADAECVTVYSEVYACGDDGLCYEKSCQRDNECPNGLICDGGRCRASCCQLIQSIVVTGDIDKLRPGLTSQLHATAYNANGAVITSDPEDFSWSCTTSQIASVDELGLVTGGEQTGTTDCCATINSKFGCLSLTNFASLAEGQVRVVVLDQRTQALVFGVVVVLDGQSTLTDESGVALFATATGPHQLHLFHQDYEYRSFYRLSGGTRDLEIPLEPLPESGAGGVRGELNFSQIPEAMVQDVRMGFTGAPIRPERLLDLDTSMLWGQTIHSRSISNTSENARDLPSGLELKLSRTYVRRYFAALADPGPTVLWAMGGYMPLSDLIEMADNFLGTPPNYALFTLAFAPFLSNFYHGLLPGATVALHPLIPDDGLLNPAPWNMSDLDGDGDTTELIPDFSQFENLTDTFKLAQAWDKVVDLVTGHLPEFISENSKPGLLIAMAAELEDIGILPLGCSLATDEDEQGLLDGFAGDQGRIADMHFAPQHSGVRGYPYLTLAAAFDLNEWLSGVDEPSDRRVSVSLSRTENPGDEMILPGFLPFPSWQPSGSENPRGFQVTTPLSGSFSRVKGEGWEIFIGPGAGAVSVALPQPADYGMADRWTGSVRLVGSVRLAAGLTYEKLVEFNNTNLDRLFQLTESYSLILGDAAMEP